jgi:glycosyltransferase involved in cell wall biosynthesis
MTKKQNNKKKHNKKNEKPFVSICTPTFNRRPFFKSIIQCYLHQDYPQHLMEWIIIDDGTDHIEDLVKDISGVKYFKYNEKMTLGKKRNLMHDKSTGDIIVYMDDDDYYPPQRVSHAVSTLMSSKRALCAGSSEIYIWFKHVEKMYQFGPYNPNHATAGTFAFKRELLKQTNYQENAALAEEKYFLKNYTIPFIQLDPKYTILCFSHEHNTFDKKKLLNNVDGKYVRVSDKTVDDFIKQSELKNFFMEEIENLLNDYEPGLPKYKPDVLKQTKEIEEEREKNILNNNTNTALLQKPDGSTQPLNIQQLVQIVQQLQNTLKENNRIVEEMKKEIEKKDNLITQLFTKLKQKQDENQIENNDNQ